MHTTPKKSAAAIFFADESEILPTTEFGHGPRNTKRVGPKRPVRPRRIPRGR